MVKFFHPLFLFTVLFRLALSTVLAQPLENPPPDHPDHNNTGPITWDMSARTTIPDAVEAQHHIDFTLPDGTHLSGLLFVDPSKGLRPLILAQYGLLSSRNSKFPAVMVKYLQEPGLLNANLLIIDGVNGVSFYSQNGQLSVGGYDAGRILVQVAQQLRGLGIPFSTLHLYGQSLGGLAVLEALLEDQRLGTKLFQSAISFCGVTNEAASTASVFSIFGHPLQGILGPKISLWGWVFLQILHHDFDVEQGKVAPQLPKLTGDVFYQKFQERLKSLALVNDWNPQVERGTVEDYINASSSLVDGIDSIRTPLIMVHAANDPLLDIADFNQFSKKRAGNPYVRTLATSSGSHCGFLGAYGAPWVADLINRSLALHP